MCRSGQPSLSYLWLSQGERGNPGVFDFGKKLFKVWKIRYIFHNGTMVFLLTSPPLSLRASQSIWWNFQVPFWTTIFKTVMERSGKIPFLTWILHFLATTSCTVTPMQNAIQGLSTQYSGLTILNLHNSRKFLLLLGHLLPTLLHYRNLFQAHIVFALVLSKVSKGHGNCWNTCWRTKHLLPTNS